MSQTKPKPEFDSDDPRLTAYVLGELDEAERASIEQRIEQSPQTRAALESIRETAGLLTEALAQEPAPSLSDSQRTAIAAAAEEAQPAGPSLDVRPATSRSKRAGIVAVMTGLMVLAASLLLLVLPPLQQRQSNSEFSASGQGLDRRTFRVDDMDVLSRGAVVATEAGSLENSRESSGGASTPLTAGRPPAAGEIAVGGVQRSQPGESRSDLLRSAVPGPRSQSAGSPVSIKQRPSSAERFSFVGRINTSENVPRDQLLLESIIQETVRGEVERRKQATARGNVSGYKHRRKIQDRQTRSSMGFEFNLPRRFGQTSSAERLLREQTGVSSKVRGRPVPPIAQDKPPKSGTIAGLKSFGRQEELSAAVAADSSRAKFFKRTELTVGNRVVGSVAAEPPGTEQYEPIVENEFLSPYDDPLSTFSIDVDTASYANVRRFLKQNQWPPAAAVRIEELVNYFRYDYAEPTDGRPFAVSLEVGPCGWDSDHRLLRIGLKGKDIDKSKRPPSNLVFLLDVSGSMRDANKLPLVKAGMEMLAGQMTEDDRVAIVTYASGAELALDSTSGQNRDRIIAAIRALRAGGSTNGEAGIMLAYQKALEHFIDNGTNRVILCTDGDFNVGTSDDNDLVKLIQDQAQSKVFLSVFGFGMGNLKDAKLEKLADKGDGQYAYVDHLAEARRVFVEEMVGMLYTIAKDVKIQIEFNPAQVGAYRLIGYENRVLAAPDFADDTKDAGEIGAGHTVTALYEIIPADKLPRPQPIKTLKYQKSDVKAEKAADKKGNDNDKADDPLLRELLTLSLRYKLPEADQSVKLQYTLTDPKDRTAMPSADFEWAAAVAGFGMLLRNSQYRGQADFELIRELALGSKGDDPTGRRREFLDLVETAQAIMASQPQPAPAAPRQSLPDNKTRWNSYYEERRD